MKKRSKSMKKIANICTGLLLLLSVGVGALVFSQPVYAGPDEDAPPQDRICKPGEAFDPQKPCVTDPSDLKSTPDPAAKTCTGGDCSGLITKYVNPFVRVLAALAPIIMAISLAYAGVQISQAGGDPGKLADGKKRIYNTLFALFAYLFLFAFLQWLLPGGIV